MKDSLVISMQEFNKFYTTILGVINNHILESEYSLTEAQIIVELTAATDLTASGIKEVLNIDEGYMSRIIAKLLKNGIIKKVQSRHDKRSYVLQLTSKGKLASDMINDQSNQQIDKLVQHLGNPEKEELQTLLKRAKELMSKKTNNDDDK